MKNHKGFTLIETIIVSLIAGFIGLGVIFAVANSNKILNNSFNQVMADGNMNRILNDLSRDVREGMALSVPYDGAYTLTIINPEGTTIIWSAEHTADFTRLVTRTNSNGSKKYYKMIGTGDDNYSSYKSIWPEFRVNIDDPQSAYGTPQSFGKYHKVWVKLSYCVQNAGVQYDNTTTENTISCRQEASAYGF
ncbi:MAG: type II secretion system GspH family protein [Candidatus Delongbacteria bacterium]|nr:type II secretion system GspH family protein [Candidatus Delongbacteria bacterium]MCG2761432.1 type II secretion system GspH family protein [Candidatus Delongbacteria bacterium]